MLAPNPSSGAVFLEVILQCERRVGQQRSDRRQVLASLRHLARRLGQLAEPAEVCFGWERVGRAQDLADWGTELVQVVRLVLVRVAVDGQNTNAMIALGAA